MAEAARDLDYIPLYDFLRNIDVSLCFSTLLTHTCTQELQHSEHNRQYDYLHDCTSILMYHCVSHSRDSACESVPSPSPRSSLTLALRCFGIDNPTFNMASSLILMRRVSYTPSQLSYDLAMLHLIITPTSSTFWLSTEQTFTPATVSSLSSRLHLLLKHTLQVWVTNWFVFQHSASSWNQKIRLVPACACACVCRCSNDDPLRKLPNLTNVL